MWFESLLFKRRRRRRRKKQLMTSELGFVLLGFPVCNPSTGYLEKVEKITQEK